LSGQADNEQVDSPPPEMTGAELRERLAAGDEVQLVDVRADHEWDAGRIEGATHIELNEIAARAEELDREVPVVLYCRGGTRSEMARDALREAGFDAHKLTGGIVDWADEEAPLEPEDGYVAESGRAAAELQARQRTD
jgi:rhodanese-related sulfurtransferase